MTDVFGPVYNWVLVTETKDVTVSVCYISNDMRVQISLKRNAEPPQANSVVYRFYDYMGVVLSWKRMFPLLTPLRWSHRRFVPVKFTNTKNSDLRCLGYIHLNVSEQDAIYDIMDSYEAVFEKFCELRGL